MYEGLFREGCVESPKSRREVGSRYLGRRNANMHTLPVSCASLQDVYMCGTRICAGHVFWSG